MTYLRNRSGHYRPSFSKRSGLGDDFFSSLTPNFSDLTVPAIDTTLPNLGLNTSSFAIPSLNFNTDTASVPPVSTASPVITSGVTSDSFWNNLLKTAAAIGPSIANAAATTAVANVQAQAAKTAAQNAQANSVSSTLSSITNSSYFPYIVIGGFVLLAVSVVGGTGRRRR